jgi:hypothetical protein
MAIRFYMDIQDLIQLISPTMALIKVGNLDEAAAVFKDLEIVDTATHLSLPKTLRHFIWDIYEFLLAGNPMKMSGAELMTDFNKIKEEAY